MPVSLEHKERVLRHLEGQANAALAGLIDRLEIRRMESAEYQARWCQACLRTEMRSPFVMLHPGDGGRCHQQMQLGTISECIASFRERQAEDDS